MSTKHSPVLSLGRTRSCAHACEQVRAQMHACMSAAMLFSSGGHGSVRASRPSNARCEACGTGDVRKKSHLGPFAARAGRGQASTAASASSGSMGSTTPWMARETRSAWFAAYAAESATSQRAKLCAQLGRLPSPRRAWRPSPGTAIPALACAGCPRGKSGRTAPRVRTLSQSLLLLASRQALGGHR